MQTVKIDLATAISVEKIVNLGMIAYYDVESVKKKYGIEAKDAETAAVYMSHTINAVKAKKKHLTMKMTTAFSTAKLCQVGCDIAEIPAQRIARNISNDDLDRAIEFNESVELQLQQKL